jgi:single-stranded-DNA-specific exonuclease
MKLWLEPPPVLVPDELRAAVGGHPLIAAQLARRDITDVQAARAFLDPAEYQPALANELPDMDKAVDRIQKAVRDRESILIWGDFDVDGQTATALLVSALRELGAQPHYHIPNRFKEGHGIHLPSLKNLLSGVDVLLTCDTGVAAHQSIEYAQAQGMDVVVTDHHALPDSLPGALAVVNPMRLAAGHALRELSGVGVAYKLVEALYGRRTSDHLLDLVALGMIADVMVQVDDVRYLLQRGLDVLRRAERPGLRAMMERAEINPAEANEETIGFDLAPRLNALGRLDDANPAVELLTSHDLSQIAVLVNRLEGMNTERKLLTRQVYEGAKAQIEHDPSLLEYAVLVIAYPGWHTGIIGVVANRLAEQYHRPVVLLSIEDGVAHGSARSVQGCDITAAIKQHSGLLNRYGGHTMAAGLSLPEGNLLDFRRQLSRTVRGMIGAQAAQPRLQIDAYVELPEITLDLAGEISRMAPFGNGNPPLTLAARHLRIRRKGTLGRREEHLELTVEDTQSRTRRVIWWNGADEAAPDGLFDLAFTLRATTYKGRREAVVEWRDARAVDSAEVTIEEKPPFAVVDWREKIPTPQSSQALTPSPSPSGRGEQNTRIPFDLQAVLEQYPDALVWGEGGMKGGADRYHLYQARTLVVWSSPPGPEEWAQALEQAQPETVVLVGFDPEWQTPEAFLMRLIGLVKYALTNKGGQAGLDELAGAMAHREAVVELGLSWLAADGQITFERGADDALQFRHPGVADAEKRQSVFEKLKTSLAETKAYRKYWRGMKF